MSIPPDYQSKHLFLLVGANPLPNYVAIQLLRKAGGHVYLIYTAESTKIADRICAGCELILGRDATKILVNDDRAHDIVTKVQTAAQGKVDIGLNYTGGTKHMVVYTHQGLLQATGGRATPTLSYLDGRTLSMRIEQGGANTRIFAVGTAVQPDFRTLLALHNYTTNRYATRPIGGRIYADLPKVPYQQFHAWWKEASTGMSGRMEQIRLPTAPPFDIVQKYWALATTLGELAEYWETSLKEVTEWFNNAGLEDYTLWSVQEIAQTATIGNSGKNIKPNELKFEFDVIAMRGYQLFAISCANSDDKEKIKLKLFEAFVRARQMGGEEARVAVICRAPSDNPNNSPTLIQGELAAELDAEGKIRVFGAQHLAALPQHLYDWFTASA